MSITYEVLGQPGRDNAVLATVNTGHSQHRLLFDCGDGCLDGVPRADVQAIEALFFSHFHIDHIAGFDRFFRANWFREQPPVRIFGPEGARNVLHHRLRGFTWNLAERLSGEVLLSEIADRSVKSARYLAREGFATEHALEQLPFDGVVYQRDEFHVEARIMHHGIPSIAYLLREKDRSNIDPRALHAAGLAEGPWLSHLKDQSIPDAAEIDVFGTLYEVGRLREQLLALHPGESLAYLTDFRPRSEQEEEELAAFLRGCRVLICEDTFCDADLPLARESHHMTSSDVGRLASRVQPEQLIVFHVSDRYTEDQWCEQLAEVRRRFDRAVFPPHWRLPST
jgi:ribonuclease Z